MFLSRALYHADGSVELFTPYNPRFVDRIKLEVPPSYRRWQPDRKTWRVEPPYDTTAIRILTALFPDAEVDQKPGGRSVFESVGCRCDADHRALYVCQEAPPAVIKAAYRALARSLHPDVGGDVLRMQKVNAAFERLSARSEA